jgi:hypothetical protein
MDGVIGSPRRIRLQVFSRSVARCSDPDPSRATTTSALEPRSDRDRGRAFARIEVQAAIDDLGDLRIERGG